MRPSANVYRLLAAALVLTIIFFHHPTLRAEAPVPRQRWEYAALMTSARLSKWTSRQSQYSEEGDKGYLQLYRDLGGKKPIQTVSLIDLLNLAGDDGWELVAIDGGDGPHQYLFKRAQA